jgi:hypothetical protein
MNASSPLPPNNWVPLLEVVELLHHPNFYWGSMGGLTNAKYLDLRIDTRDLRCIVKDRDGKPLSLDRIREGLADPVMTGMNENPQIEIKVVAREREPQRVVV